MTDTTQGADAPNESALFNEATASDTLEKFENPAPVAPDKPAAPPDKVADKPADKPDDNAPVPSGRFREESEARRRAERERDALQARLDARQPPQAPAAPQTAPPAVDLFENPKGFVHQELKPYLEQMQSEFQQQRESMSLDFAKQRHGTETVDAAYQALRAGMLRGDPEVLSIYNRVMKSHDPYGQIVQWHQQGETLRAIGGDLDGYKKRILDEAMADPEYRAKVIEAAKGQAAAAGSHVARPVKPLVASSPSLGDIGAGGGDTQVIEPSDSDLFRAATSAKRR